MLSERCVAGGLLLLTGRWLPLGLTLLGPVIVNILAFHVLMAPAGLGMAIVVSALALFLVWRYRENSSPDLCARRNLGGVKSQLWMSGLNR